MALLRNHYNAKKTSKSVPKSTHKLYVHKLFRDKRKTPPRNYSENQVAPISYSL